jgi:hypothetical protein
MDTSSEPVKPRSNGLELHWVVVLMFASFVAGAFLGLHPSWLPFNPFPGSDVDATAGDSQSVLRAFTAPPASQASATQSTTRGE